MALLALLAGMGCERSLDVVPTSYLAIVTLFDDTTLGGHQPVQYRVTELSGTLGIDTIISRSPSDTVVLDLPPATYTVTVHGLPSTCAVARGTEQYVQVYPPPSTALARYFALCKPSLVIAALTDGSQLDPDYIWHVDGPGISKSGLMGPNDSVRVEGLPAGSYVVSLGHVSGNCLVTSDGGLARTVALDTAGGAAVLFRVVCSDEAQRPKLLSFVADYRNGTSVIGFRATDPDRDIERYVWDLTDCQGRSILPGGARERRGLSFGRTRQQDTVTVISAFEPGLPDSLVRRGCTALRVADELLNSTPIVELPFAEGVPGSAPSASTFNAWYVGTTAVQTDVQLLDPDHDLLGYFVAIRLRDGVLGGSPDGQPDLGIYNTAGYLALPLPQQPLSSGRIAYGDVLAVIVYGIDARGHFVRLEDQDLFQ